MAARVLKGEKKLEQEMARLEAMAEYRRSMMPAPISAVLMKRAGDPGGTGGSRSRGASQGMPYPVSQ